MTHAPRWAAAPSGLCQGWLAFMERQAVRDNAVVTSFDQRDQARLERHTLLTCKIGRVACAAQQALHLACPVLFLDLDQRLQFPQMVRIAQRVQHAGHRVVRLPVVMHDNAGDLRQQAAPDRHASQSADRDGNLIDTMLSPTRDMKAARRFFRSARSVAGFVPDRVTTDGHNSYPRAIRSTLGRNVRHRTSVYLNNRLEQDHRGIKGRIRCMRGFKEHEAADRFCREYDELRNFLRSRSRHNQYVPATRRRRHFLQHARIAMGIMQIA